MLPVYHPDRAGWVVALRRSALFLGIVLLAFVYGVLSAILPPSLLMIAAVPLAIMALLVIWALPEARSAPTRSLTYSLAVFIFVMICWPNYMAVSVSGLPWISMRRLLGMILTLLLIVCVSSSKSFRKDLIDVFRSYPLIARCLIAVFVLQFLASVLSISPGLTIGRWISIALSATAVCFATIWVFGPGGKSVRWFSNRLLIGVLVLMVIAVFEARAQQVLWVNHIPGFLKIDEEMLAQMTKPHFRNGYRVLTTYTTALAYGELLALTTPFVIYRIMSAKDWTWRLIWVAYDIALLYSTILSTARLAVVGYFVAHAIFGLLWGLHRWRTARGDMLGITATMMYPAFVVALALAVLFVPAVHNRVLGGGAVQSSNDARRVQWEMAVPVIESRPILGYGPGQGGPSIGYRTPDGMLTLDLGLVAQAADYGLICFACYMLMILFSIVELIRSGLRDRAEAYPVQFVVASALIVLLTTRLVLAQADNEPLFAMLYGLSLATLYKFKRFGSSDPAQQTSWEGAQGTPA